MANRSLEVEIHFLPGRKINLVVPKQTGVSYEEAAPALAAFATSLSVEYGLPVDITSEPEQHLHDPESVATFASGRVRADHGHAH